jgi:hypothetical protein
VSLRTGRSTAKQPHFTVTRPASRPVLVTGLVVLAGVIVTLTAGPVPAQGSPTWTRPGFEPVSIAGSWTPLRTLVADRHPETAAAWRRFERTVGPGWSVQFDPGFDTPRWIVGPGWDHGQGRLSTDRAEAVSRDIVYRLAPALGIDLADRPQNGLRLVRVAATATPAGHTLLGVDFVQTHDGYDVRTLIGSNRVRLRINDDLGRLAALGSDFVSGLRVDTIGVLDRPAAESRARELTPGLAPGVGRVLTFETYVLVGLAGESGSIVGRLVHEVRLRTEDPPHLWRVVLDARTGEPVHLADNLRHASILGSVSGGLLTGAGGTPPQAAFKVLPLGDLEVKATTLGTTTTDAQGRFQFNVPKPLPAPVRVSGRLHGLWCSIVNRAGPDLSFSVLTTLNQPANVVLNPRHTHEWNTAQTTTYWWITYAHHFIARQIPNYAGWPGLATHVNEIGTCNASWDGMKLHFLRSGGGCSNTAFADMVLHEYGHAFHQRIHGKTVPAGFSEGIGDHLTLYGTGQRQVGRGFYTNGSPLRDYRPGQPACCTRWPATGKLPHKAGEIWAGFTMDLRDALIKKHGLTKGVATAENITVAPYARDPDDMPDAVLEVFIQDDNDANLKNGTPNFPEIAAAADAHALPRPSDPPPVTIAHSPLPDTGDVVNGYRVDATVQSSQAALDRVTLYYRIGGGSSVPTLMQKGQNQHYTATIPPQPAVGVVRYRIVARDQKNNTASWPAQGEHLFVVGRVHDVFHDDFEAARGWTVGGSAVPGRFHRADPFFARSTAGVSQPEDDHTPGAGRSCFITQNGLRNQDPALHDVDNGDTAILSPRLDLSGETADAVRIRFAYWFTDHAVADDALAVAVSRDDGRTWKDIWTESTPLDAWRVARVEVPAPYTTTMRFRFRVSDFPNNSICDVLIDDVAVEGADSVVATLRAQTRTPTRGQALRYTLTSPRTPNGAFIFSVSFLNGPTKIPGVGTSMLGWPILPIWIAPLDPNGAAAFPIPIVDHPAVVGLNVFSEAFVGTASQVFLFSSRWDFQIRDR